MNKELTKSQEKKLLAFLNEKKANEKNLSLHDILLSIFLPSQKGIILNGKNISELIELVEKISNFEIKDYKDLAYFRTNVSQFKKKLWEEGFAFGSLKDGKYVKYGWADDMEIDKIRMERMRKFKNDISNDLEYIPEDNILFLLGKTLVDEIDKQLTFF